MLLEWPPRWKSASETCYRYGPQLTAIRLNRVSNAFIVTDPVGVAPIFVALTRHLQSVERRVTLTTAVITAFGVTLFFLLAGRYVLNYLGVTVRAFAISGGILLFATALPMLFGQRPGLQAPERDEHRAVERKYRHIPSGYTFTLRTGHTNNGFVADESSGS